MADQIPRVVVLRLPMYARVLSGLVKENRKVVNSQELGARLQVTPAQIRKDLSYFGKFGKQGSGYSVKKLLAELRGILGLDREWSVAVIGVGRLGKALIKYPGFAPQGFNVVGAFDNNPHLINKKVGRVTVRSIDQLEDSVRELGIRVGIVAVPAPEAQNVVTVLLRCGVKAILNYAPAVVQVPKDVQLREIDPLLALQSMTFYLKETRTPQRDRGVRS